jgi:hypothetical protein
VGQGADEVRTKSFVDLLPGDSNDHDYATVLAMGTLSTADGVS